MAGRRPRAAGAARQSDGAVRDGRRRRVDSRVLRPDRRHAGLRVVRRRRSEAPGRPACRDGAPPARPGRDRRCLGRCAGRLRLARRASRWSRTSRARPAATSTARRSCRSASPRRLTAWPSCRWPATRSTGCAGERARVGPRRPRGVSRARSVSSTAAVRLVRPGWSNPGAYLSSVLADEDQRHSLVAFVDDVLGGGTQTRPRRLDWLPIVDGAPRISICTSCSTSSPPRRRDRRGVRVSTAGPTASDTTRTSRCSVRAKDGHRSPSPLLLGTADAVVRSPRDVTVDRQRPDPRPCAPRRTSARGARADRGGATGPVAVVCRCSSCRCRAPPRRGI